MDRIENDVQQFFYCMCIRWRGNVFTESLPSNDKGIHIQTHRLTGGIYNYTVGMGLDTMLYIRSFIKNGSGIQKLMEGGFKDRQRPDRIILFSFFRNK
jgi:hypothetical protein